mmetsp:Transcript_8862/g.17924  ORF Transcript_8862/g.17924 Transcript_8862/m.17924 type:complete len:280 (-) Transcript_8862:239-1078(-)
MLVLLLLFPLHLLLFPLLLHLHLLLHLRLLLHLPLLLLLLLLLSLSHPPSPLCVLLQPPNLLLPADLLPLPRLVSREVPSVALCNLPVHRIAVGGIAPGTSSTTPTEAYGTTNVGRRGMPSALIWGCAGLVAPPALVSLIHGLVMIGRIVWVYHVVLQLPYLLLSGVNDLVELAEIFLVPPHPFIDGLLSHRGNLVFGLRRSPPSVLPLPPLLPHLLQPCGVGVLGTFLGPLVEVVCSASSRRGAIVVVGLYGLRPRPLVHSRGSPIRISWATPLVRWS